MEDTEAKDVFSEKDLHCMARLIQTIKFGLKPFDTCMYCKYKCHTEKELAPNFDEICFRLMKLTGVDLGFNRKKLHSKGGEPYWNLLKNSNDEIKKHFTKYFEGVL